MSAVVAQSQRHGVDVAELFAIETDSPAVLRGLVEQAAVRPAVYDVLTHGVPARADVAAG
jgi:hypothetical protein